MDSPQLQAWLAEAPKYTIFRVNKLMQFNDTKIKSVLEQVL